MIERMSVLKAAENNKAVVDDTIVMVRASDLDDLEKTIIEQDAEIDKLHGKIDEIYKQIVIDDDDDDDDDDLLDDADV